MDLYDNALEVTFTPYRHIDISREMAFVLRDKYIDHTTSLEIFNEAIKPMEQRIYNNFKPYGSISTSIEVKGLLKRMAVTW